MLQTIEKVSNRLVYKYTFDIHSEGDLKQEAFLMAVDALERYDNQRPLENFLYIHINNRLKTFKRDNFCRQEPQKGTPEWDKWHKVGGAKKNLLEAITLDSVNPNNETNLYEITDFVANAEYEQILKLIDEHLDPKLRKYYIKFLHKDKIPKAKRELLMRKIKEIVEEYYV